MHVAFIFPGQGSQFVGMDGGLDADTFAEADEALGYALSAVIREGPAERLAETENTQPEAPLPERPSRSVAITRKPEPLPHRPKNDLGLDLRAELRPSPAPAPPAPVVPAQGASPVASAWLEDIAPNPDTSPFGAALLSLFCLPGLGQIYNGRVGKGLFALVSTAMLSAVTGGGSLCVTSPLLCADAWCVAAKRRKGRWVGSWEWF